MPDDVYKEYKLENGRIVIRNPTEYELTEGIPEWIPDDEASDALAEQCFTHQGSTFFLSGFLNIHNKAWNPNPPGWQREFDGVLVSGYGCGYLLKIVDDKVLLYYFYSMTW